VYCKFNNSLELHHAATTLASFEIFTSMKKTERLLGFSVRATVYPNGTGACWHSLLHPNKSGFPPNVWVAQPREPAEC
jgi:hypothetical protein